MHEGNPESLVENPVVAQIAAEHEDEYRTEAREVVPNAHTEIQILTEADKRFGRKVDVDARKILREAAIKAEIYEAQAPIAGEQWRKITEIAVEKGLPLPLTRAEQEEYKGIVGKMPGVNQAEFARFKALQDRRDFNDYGHTRVPADLQDNPDRQALKNLYREYELKLMEVGADTGRKRKRIS